MRFYYVYKSLAHPETNGYLTPYTLDERLRHIREAKLRISTRIPWLADNMGDALKRSLLAHGAHNAEFVFGPDGKLVRRRFWSDPTALRADLGELVGAVEHPTQPNNATVRYTPRPLDVSASDLKALPVARRPLPVTYRSVEVRPILRGIDPFYAKLRVKVDQKLMREGTGRMYLALHLDPIYDMHWNNLAGPVEIEATAPEGARVSPSRMAAEIPATNTDSAPREFFLHVQNLHRGASIRVRVRYFACSKGAGGCTANTQVFEVPLLYEAS